MSNIAEGFESQTQAMFIKYLHQAKASAGEVRSQLYIALDLGYISDDEFRISFDLIKKKLAVSFTILLSIYNQGQTPVEYRKIIPHTYLIKKLENNPSFECFNV